MIQFDADQCYISQHRPGSDTYFAGKWWVEGSTITLMEGSTPTRYDFVMDVRTWPDLKGTSNGTCGVRLRRLRMEGRLVGRCRGVAYRDSRRPGPLAESYCANLTCNL